MFMKGQYNSSYIIIIIAAVIVLFWYIQQVLPYNTATVGLDTHEIAVKDKSYSQVIIASVTRTDSQEGRALFYLEFVQSNNVFAVDSNGLRLDRIPVMLTSKGDSSFEAFRLHARKAGPDQEEYELRVQVWSSDEKLLAEDYVQVKIE